MKSYSITTLSLSGDVLRDTKALRKKGHKLIDIFKAGVADIKARSPKKLF